jgi:hypothetical protein
MHASLEPVLSTWRRGARVRVDQGGLVSYRPALFVFHVGDSLVWVEPSYLDPFGAGTPASHQGRLIGEAGLGEYQIDGGGWTALVFPVAEDDDLPAVAQAIEPDEWLRRREEVRALL